MRTPLYLSLAAFVLVPPSPTRVLPLASLLSFVIFSCRDLGAGTHDAHGRRRLARVRAHRGAATYRGRARGPIDRRFARSCHRQPRTVRPQRAPAAGRDRDLGPTRHRSCSMSARGRVLPGGELPRVPLWRLLRLLLLVARPHPFSEA